MLRDISTALIGAGIGLSVGQLQRAAGGRPIGLYVIGAGALLYVYTRYRAGGA